jgi:DinB family protein
MNDNEIVMDLLSELVRQTGVSIRSLTHDELTWQPDPHGNNIAVTVWHYTRWWDILAVRAFQNKPAEEELWFTRGWYEQTRYDPRGIGVGGLGALTGYTWAEVEAVPILSATELMQYLDMSMQAMLAFLHALPEGGLFQIAPGLGGNRTYYDWIKEIGTGSFRHVGEIQTLKALRQRRLNIPAAAPAPATAKIVAG